MYQRTRHFADFHIAGLTYGDGIELIQELKPGTKLDLKSEPDNPYDPNAVAIYYANKRLGYIPAAANSEISQLLYFGHNIFDTTIIQLTPDQHPSHQIRVVVRLKDDREAG